MSLQQTVWYQTCIYSPYDDDEEVDETNNQTILPLDGLCFQWLDDISKLDEVRRQNKTTRFPPRYSVYEIISKVS